MKLIDKVTPTFHVPKDKGSMAGNGLCCTCVGAKCQITAKCANCYCQHYPTIVGHEQEPILLLEPQAHFVKVIPRDPHIMKKL